MQRIRKGIIGVIILLLVSVSVIPTAESISRIKPTLDNEPPNKPKITGPQLISTPGPHEWTFKATDSDGDNLFLFIDWGDGTADDWFGPFESGEEITRNHTYTKYGRVLIRVRAKDIHGAMGDWGSFQFININKHITNLPFLQFLIHFPLLQRLLGWLI